MSTVQPTPQPETPTQAGETRSLGEIVGDITTDMSTLIRQEMDYAKTLLQEEVETAKNEVKEEVAKVGKGAGMFAGAGVSALLMLIFVSLALTYLLDNWMPVELAALIVGVLWAIAAAVLAMSGRKKIKEANPQLPKTQQTIKEDVQWAKTQKP